MLVTEANNDRQRYMAMKNDLGTATSVCIYTAQGLLRH